MANDFFIKIDGIDGESEDKSHGKWIECLGFSLGSVQSVAAGRATDVAGRGHFTPFVFTHLLDKASPKLQQYCMAGQKVAKVQFHVCRAIAGAQVPVYEVTLENVKISCAQISTVPVDAGTNPGAGAIESMADRFTGVEKTNLPIEEVSLVAAKITWKYTAVKEDNTKEGAVEASYNQVENS